MSLTIEGLRKRVTNALGDEKLDRGDRAELIKKAQGIAKRITNANSGNQGPSSTDAVVAKTAVQANPLPVDLDSSKEVEKPREDGRKLLAKV